MRTTSKNLIIFLLAFAVGLSFSGFIASTSLAAEVVGEKVGSKLVRGVGNTAFGYITEIPEQIGSQYAEHSYSGILSGVVTGIGHGTTRTVVGAYETATFPLPLPADYKPVIEPKYSWE